ncbi:FAD binding domain-containing protein [Marinisporobacter balticus]|uniref:Purine hydroxylase gamma subunit apoprotein n=1 Tax=Marinisporobacter balticus TaxID=2018667 RepID=A0A4R2KYA3_9FIRM|nr:FAD binding domain-containing protein [Marinisporobacter balticus]TCO75258.1 purine hydroxylase gamma subunit apoprotein [Marinisporobacter balticus]
MIRQCITPSTLEAVLNILDEEGKDVELIAGGTDLVIDIRNEKFKKSKLLNIAKFKLLKFININEDKTSIGSGTKFTDIVENGEVEKLFLGLWKACKSVGAPQIRNMGTIGGNICNGSPAADSVPPLLALDANLIMISKDKERVIPLREFYLDKGRVDRREDELLYAIKFNTLKRNEGIAFEKLGLRKALAISRISCSIYIQLEKNDYIKNIRIATGALGKYPQREVELECMLKNQEISTGLLNTVSKHMSHIVEQRLKGRSSMHFKRSAISGLFIKTCKDAVEEAKKNV